MFKILILANVRIIVECLYRCTTNNVFASLKHFRTMYDIARNYIEPYPIYVI